jgi:hypothetical protein
MAGVSQEALSQQQSSHTRRLECLAIVLSDPQILWNCKLLRIREELDLAKLTRPAKVNGRTAESDLCVAQHLLYEQ